MERTEKHETPEMRDGKWKLETGPKKKQKQ